MSNNTKLIKKIIIAAAFLVCVAALAIMSRERAAGSAANATESITTERFTTRARLKRC